MTSLPGKLLPLAAAWLILVLAVARYFRHRQNLALLAAAVAYAGGIGCTFLLQNGFRGEIPYLLARSAAAGAFLLLFGLTAATFYRSSRPGFSLAAPGRSGRAAVLAGAAALGLLAGILSTFRLPWGGPHYGIGIVLLLVAGILLPPAASRLERLLPDWLPLTRESFILLGVSLLLLLAAQSPRLDIFSPLTMKVTKFIHDFVHQFFESLLIPDHPFFRTEVWDFIGLLFSPEVGFWGGLVIWFLPAALVFLATVRTRLPSVAHIRQGAMRRKVLAGHFRERRRLAIVPVLALAVLLLAVYQSRHPSVDYWDPQPVELSATPAGEIFIPRSTEAIDLADGRLHKFLFREGTAAVRFFVLQKEDGKLAVVLDACAICPPDGYGQAPGVVICYACRTLIPVETVGLPGGCNPVPVQFAETSAGVHLAASTLLNTWRDAVQSGKPVPERSR